MTATSEPTLSDASYFGWSRLWVESVDGGEVLERDGVLLTITSAPQEWWNIAFVTRQLDEPGRTLRETVALFEQRNQPFVMRIREGLDPAAERAAEALGLEYTDTMPGMRMEPIAPSPAPPQSLEIVPVMDGATLDDCVVVLAEAYEMEPDLTRKLMPMRLIERPPWTSYVGYVDGAPAATASVAQTGAVAGITFVGTRQGFRKRGFGEAVTWRAVGEGAAQGCRLAALEASEMGYPIYQRMGFRHVTGYKTFVLPKYRS